MNLHEHLTRLSGESSPIDVRPLQEIEQRAGARRKAARVRGGIGLLLVGALAVTGISQVDWSLRDQNHTTAPASGGKAGVGPTSEMASQSPTPCAFDACGPGRPLSQGKSWLAGVLDSVGLKYRDEYRDDGGGFYLLPEWKMAVWVLPPEPDPSVWAASHEYRPLWKSHGVVVYGRAKETSQVAYLYWQAGGVITFVETGYSQVSQPEDLREVTDRIIAQQLKDEYPDGG